ncbi:type II toxin-antitoxin system VapC family toxin [Candidatus Palauibacter sp.]|uniref:type II toxin-antitoxin system VapC family toxin n=1 Tax=Candidatus Palauibacter sp. TaxID=3101350 RepID=UPI003AF26411
MIVVDTGPLVAAFDPSDSDHAAWKQVLAEFGEEALTTIPVLTEAFHFLSRRPRQALGLMELVRYGPLTVSRLGDRDLGRCFELMLRYGDTPMDFADASVVAVAERSGIDRVFTLDQRHFAAYRMKRGQRHVALTLVGPEGEPPMVRETGDPDAAYGTELTPAPHEGRDAPDAVTGRLLAETALREAREALDRLGRALGG